MREIIFLNVKFKFNLHLQDLLSLNFTILADETATIGLWRMQE